MMAAISAAKIAGGHRVCLLEKNDVLGRKLLATGNGRCNFSNRHCTCKDLKEFARESLDVFGVQETLDFFEEIGVYWREEAEGRLYPYSEQASAVQEALLWQLKVLDVDVLPSFPVVSIRKSGVSMEAIHEDQRDTGFEILGENGILIATAQLILATGGKSGISYGSAGDGYRFAKMLGHEIRMPIPVLVPVLCQNKVFKELKGVRTKARVALACKDDVLLREDGEIQFTAEGLSGICIFNLSRHIRVKNIQEGFKDYAIIIDFFPEMTEEALLEKLKHRNENLAGRAKEDFLSGAINKKLGTVLLGEADVDLADKGKVLTAEELAQLSKVLKAWKVSIEGTKGWKEAQATSGGIYTEEIDQHTMASKIIRGLYFAGEVMDVDGQCGGYNLQWAWTSGFVAGKCAAMNIGRTDVKNT